MLDRRFFERVSTTNKEHGSTNNNNSICLESYKAVYARSTMVLFSRKTHTPLAALTLKADDIGCLSMFTARPPPPQNQDIPHFQGMLNMPNQVFTLTISNLSDVGMINFNILHTPSYRVSTVDPGPAFGINQVNELHPNQSYTVQADQRNNCRMILAGKTKTTVQGEEAKPVTVRESEQSKEHQGLYFYLSVVADRACQPLVTKFAEGTVWKVVPGFVRQTTRVVTRPTSMFMSMPAGRPSLEDTGMRDEEDFCDFLDSAGPSASPVAPTRRGRWEGASFRSARLGSMASRSQARGGEGWSGWFREGHLRRGGGLSRSSMSQGSPARRMSQEVRSPPTAQVGAALQPRIRAPPAAAPTPQLFTSEDHSPLFPGLQAAAAPLTAPSPVWEDQSFLSGDRSHWFLGERVAAAPEAAPVPPTAQQSCSWEDYPPPSTSQTLFGSSAGQPKGNVGTSHVDVGSTQAGELKYGEQITVSSGHTGHEYDYDHPSEPTVLCLSIWHEMKFLPLPDIKDELSSQVKEWLENEGKNLIEALNAIYTTNTCVIDLESEPDTIVCTCGHQCINHANVSPNLRKCPMCRNPITAFVRADGLVLQ